MVIHKYRVKLQDEPQSVLMGDRAQLLSVQNQDGFPTIWAMHRDDLKPKELRVFQVVATGQHFDYKATLWHFIGTVQFEGGRLVFHVFELT